MTDRPTTALPGAQVAGRPVKVGFISLGCAKNLVDTESMIGLLQNTGYQITNREEEADVLVVNTCGFIEEAKRESIEAILEAAQQKTAGRCQALVVAGCMVPRYGEELAREIPEIDALVGTADYPRIGEVVAGILAGQRVQQISDPDAIADWKFERVLATPGYTAYIKIAEGCDCACAFCSIPLMRGRHRSRPMESILDEARRLAQMGVRELVVISQDTTYYGIDLYKKPMLASLLRELARVESIRWIRIHYSYPTRITDELIEVIATEPKVLNYLDLPLQHGSNRLLRIMNRPANAEGYLKLVQKLRERIPDICLRSTFIAGHPGETEADFQMLLDFLKACEFDHVGVFAYSQEEDTKSGKMEQLPEELRIARRDQAMAVQQEIARKRNQAQVGRELEVLVEGRSPRGRGWFVGRCYRQSPGIDGVVLFQAPVHAQLKPGDMVQVAITGVQDYDLLGRTTEPLTVDGAVMEEDLSLPVFTPGRHQ
ncbi:30S ribosomal protein S12 methylthiotransferase RimO [Symbiobacterium terraclitae]|uniref:30S ribosomal protein S12 methylthiotransferase RimO n=1 Tax=Symbiobacterium terraclitae TaxID=557451 RepID=UPI0035B56FE4